MRSHPRFALGLLSVFSVFVLAVAACGGDDTPIDGGGGLDGSTTRTDGGPRPDGAPPEEDGGGGPGGERFTITWGPLTIDPRAEDTRCVVKRVGNTEQIRVGQIINDLGPSSHHLIVYRTSDTEERPDPFPCTPFLDTIDPAIGAPLAITQRESETITLPAGVGYTFPAGQMVRIELHFLNTTATDVNVAASTTLVTIPEADFENEADFLFIGTPDIDIAARSTQTVGPMYLPLPAELADSQFFAITGHTHQFGTNVNVETAPSRTGAGSPVYAVRGWNWDEPETVYHDPAFSVPGGGGFRFSCDYDNTSDRNVQFGESANAEMCFFWAYYYPSRGAKVCIRSDAYGADACCPGSPLCSVLLSLL